MVMKRFTHPTAVAHCAFSAEGGSIYATCRTATRTATTRAQTSAQQQFVVPPRRHSAIDAEIAGAGADGVAVAVADSRTSKLWVWSVWSGKPTTMVLLGHEHPLTCIASAQQ
jgi:hypothetical protein